MTFDDIRRITITALFSDDVLMEMLVLKGGNALSLVHGLSERTSLDLDFSMAADFPDLADARRRLFKVLEDRFDAVGLAVFDQVLEPKPRIDGVDEKPWWGGYELRFKLIEPARYNALKGRHEKLRFQAKVTGATQSRTFKVDFSKHEYTGGKQSIDFDHYRIQVYSPEMIVVEKLRAICQQLPDYAHRGRPSARARDFYDIHRVITLLEVDLTQPHNLELVDHIFAAKRVPVRLLGRIRDQREFHRQDWQSVIDSTRGELREFDFYFEFVLDLIERMKVSAPEALD